MYANRARLTRVPICACKALPPHSPPSPAITGNPASPPWCWTVSVSPLPTSNAPEPTLTTSPRSPRSIHAWRKNGSTWPPPKLRPLGIALQQLPGAFRVNFVDGAESTAHILHSLDLAVAVGRIMAADLMHDGDR
jgi:hypothetical protein